MFLLSFTFLNNSLEYEIGANITNIYGYDSTGTLQNNTQFVVYDNAFYSGNNSHTIGYYMAIISFVGFVGVLFGLTSVWKKESARKRKEEGLE
jgi:hypothetical protein